MRNLTVCCDGTWNTLDQTENGVPIPTNVVRLYYSLDKKDAQGNEQLAYYHPGVGTSPSLLDKALGGGVGAGLDKNIKSAYRWVCDHHQDGDRLFLFGFSRGAYTVRSLGGFLARCGILELDGLSESDAWERVDKAYDAGYRKKDNKWVGQWALKVEPKDVRVHFIGVWDTVGALGVPDDMVLLNLLDNLKSHTFHDTSLSPAILHGRHAVALDEKRASFTPTLWTNTENRDVKQVWFPGVHCDVGGGYMQTGLSDGALSWMMQEAKDLGLQLIDQKVNQISPNPQDVLHDSVTSVFKLMRTQPRSTPPIAADVIHHSALNRHQNPPITQKEYRPTYQLAQGEKTTLRIYAAEHWNDTGIYLEAGKKYRFTASGEWLDSSIKCGPGGTDDGKFNPAEVVHLAMSLWGKVEKLAKTVTSNQTADFQGTRREEDMPWFALVGVVANGGNPQVDGTPEPHETFLIGDGCEHTVKKSGYFHGFANDAWNLYENNHGSVSLTVERMS